MLGRFLGGCGATGPLSAWAARTYPPQKRVQIESMQKASQMFGVMVGPALNALYLNVDFQVNLLHINPCTLAGYVPALVSAVLLIGFLCQVVEPPLEAATTAPMSPVQRLWRTGAWACLFLGFNMNLLFSALDTIISPINSRKLGWGLFQNSMVFAGLALLSLIGAALAIVAGKRGVKAVRILLVATGLN